MWNAHHHVKVSTCFLLILVHEVFPPFFSGECTVENLKSGENMDKKYPWQESYEAALLELRPEALQQQINEAENAIQQRIAELRRNNSSSAEEGHALDDALRMLRFLASTECKIPRATVPGSTQGQATS